VKLTHQNHLRKLYIKDKSNILG